MNICETEVPFTILEQYRSIKSWDKRYDMFVKKREEVDRNIVSEYELDHD